MTLLLERPTSSRGSTQAQSLSHEDLRAESYATGDTTQRVHLVVSHQAFEEFWDLVERPPRMLRRLRALVR
jgi:hypothetical protein